MSAQMPPKRPADTDTKETSKRFRSVIDESVDEFLCPITHSLPLDPVLAEDGKVYERCAIEQWLNQHQRSPATNEAMGTKLVAAVQIKNMIERMVKSDALASEKVAEWKKRIEEQEQVDALRRKTEAGDADAAYKLAALHEKGKKCLVVDKAKARQLYQKGAVGGDKRAMGRLSMCYYRGLGGGKNIGLAVRWASAAAALGDWQGMMVLGKIYFEGGAGIPVDKEEGFRLYLAGVEAGNPNAKAYCKLARMYEEGEGTPIDMDKATEAMRKAVAELEPPGSVDQAREWLTAHGLEVEPPAA